MTLRTNSARPSHASKLHCAASISPVNGGAEATGFASILRFRGALSRLPFGLPPLFRGGGWGVDGVAGVLGGGVFVSSPSSVLKQNKAARTAPITAIG